MAKNRLVLLYLGIYLVMEGSLDVWECKAVLSSQSSCRDGHVLLYSPCLPTTVTEYLNVASAPEDCIVNFI